MTHTGQSRVRIITAKENKRALVALQQQTTGQRDSRTEGQQEGSWLQHLLQEEAGAGSQQPRFVLSWKRGQELWSTLLCTSALSNHSCALSYSTQRVTERGQTLGSSRGI